MAIFNSKLLVYQRVSGDNLGQRLRNRVSGCIRYSIKRDYSQVIVALDKVPISSQRFNGFPLHLASSSLMWVVCVSSLNTKKTCFPLKAISCFSLSVTSQVFIILDSIQNWIKFLKKYHLPFKTTLKTCFYISFQPQKIQKKQTTTPKKAVFLVASSCLVAPRRASSLAQAPLNGRHSLRSVAAAATKQRAQQRAPKAPTSQGKSNKAKLAVDDCDSLRLVLFGFQWTSEIGNFMVIFDGISLRNPGEIPTFYGNPHGNPRQCKRSSTLRTSTPGRRF